jgi:hypothetical protein
VTPSLATMIYIIRFLSVPYIGYELSSTVDDYQTYSKTSIFYKWSSVRYGTTPKGWVGIPILDLVGNEPITQ